MSNSSYFLFEVRTEDQAQTMREIRNECRLFMTNNTNEISPNQQSKWFASLDRTEFIPFLFVEVDYGVCFSAAGYGLLRSKEGITFLTGGLKKSERGKRLGGELFVQLISEAKKQFNQPIHLEVLRDNNRAYRLYERLGFKPLYTTDEIVRMQLIK